MKTDYLLHREVEHVLAALTPVNRVIMRVCMHTGFRVGDVLALRTAQIAPRFWVTEQKTGKRRMVGLPAGLLADMRKIAGEIWVFESPRDSKKHRSRQGVWKDVKRAARAFRLPQNVAPHSSVIFALFIFKNFIRFDEYSFENPTKNALKYGKNSSISPRSLSCFGAAIVKR